MYLTTYPWELIMFRLKHIQMHIHVTLRTSLQNMYKRNCLPTCIYTYTWLSWTDFAQQIHVIATISGRGIYNTKVLSGKKTENVCTVSQACATTYVHIWSTYSRCHICTHNVKQYLYRSLHINPSVVNTQDYRDNLILQRLITPRGDWPIYRHKLQKHVLEYNLQVHFVQQQCMYIAKDSH